MKQKEADAAALKALSSEMQNVQIHQSLNDEKKDAEPVLIVKKRAWVPEGKRQESILISICNHFRKEIGEKRRKIINKIKSSNKLRSNPTPTNIGKAAKELSDALKKEKKKKKKDKKKRKQKRKEEKKNAFAVSEFERMNAITNYFPNDGTKKNAFDILGKKKKTKKYQSTTLKIEFNGDGSFKMPIKIGTTKLIKSLGVISTDNKYCTTSNIYPIGYKCVIQSLPSLKRPGQTTTYTTTINKGEKGPIFEITCSDDKEFKLTANNASNVWNQLNVQWMALKDGDDKSEQKEQKTAQENVEEQIQKNDEQNNEKKVAKSPRSKLSGPKKIGLSHQDIKRAIECLPNAEKCTKYKFKYRTDLEATSTAKKAWKKSLRIKSSKKDKKERKPQPKEAVPSITNICTVNNINIINNINISASPMPNHNVQNMQNKENPIVIEDSPTICNERSKKEENAVIDLCNSDVENDNGMEKTKIIKSKSRKRKHPISPDKPQNNLNEEQPKKTRKIANSESINLNELLS